MEHWPTPPTFDWEKDPQGLAFRVLVPRSAPTYKGPSATADRMYVSSDKQGCRLYFGTCYAPNASHDKLPCKIVQSSEDIRVFVVVNGEEVSHTGTFNILPIVPYMQLVQFDPETDERELMLANYKPVVGGFEVQVSHDESGIETSLDGMVYHGVADIIDDCGDIIRDIPGKVDEHFVCACFPLY